MFEVGDIVKDISEQYSDLSMTGIIVNTFVVGDLRKPMYHIRFFGDSNLVPLYEYEIEKVS
jgi:hypothetical protein